jgi:hypothetical protein
LSLLLVAWNLSSENWLHLVYDNCTELMRSLACNGRECCHCELTQNETKCIVDDKYGRNTQVHPPVWVKFCILIENIGGRELELLQNTHAPRRQQVLQKNSGKDPSCARQSMWM